MSTATPIIDEEQQRSDQIALHFYTKLFHVVYQARAFPGELNHVNSQNAHSSPLWSAGELDERESGKKSGKDRDKDKDRPPKPKIDRWFNLETPDSDLFPRELREIYKSLSSLLVHNSLRPSPPLRIHVLLVVPESTNNQVLVTLSQSNTPSTYSSSRILIEPTPRYVLLETWKMEFAPNPDSAQPPTLDVALPTIYKHGIPLFRSLYSLLRILPAWKLFKKLRRRTNSAAQFAIQLRATERADDSWLPLHGEGDSSRNGGVNVLDFDKLPATGHPPLPTLTHVFPSIPHPLGSFTLSATYLESPTFQLDDLESLLSSKFISLDEGGFVPTLSSATTATTSNASSATTSTTASSNAAAVAASTSTSIPASHSNLGNKPQRTPIHPPELIADRFVIPVPSPSASTNTGQGQGHFSHLRQPSLLHQHHHRHQSDTFPGGAGTSPPPSTINVPLPAALSRLRLESNQQLSSSSSANRLSPSPSPTSKTAFSPPPQHASTTPPHIGTPPQNTVPLPSLPSLHSLASLPPLSSPPPTSPSPTSTQAMPIKRPINPFKTNTLLSASGSGAGGPTSSSLGTGGQPGSAGSIHSIHSIISHSGSIASLRHPNTASPLSREGGGRELSRSPPQQLQALPFPTSTSSGGGGSPGPTFQKLGASSAGFGSASTAAETGLGGIGIPGHRKRYSSSFTHRYTSSAGSGSGGSDGRESREGRAYDVVPIAVIESGPGVSASPAPSTGSGSRGGRGRGSSSSPLARGSADEKSNSRSSSFLGKQTEDDDISLFMQDIETRKPLSGRWRMEAGSSGGSGDASALEGAQQVAAARGHKRDGTDGTDGTDRTVRAESVASEVTVRDDRTVGESGDGGDEEGDEEEQDGGEGEERESRKQRFSSYPNQPSPLSRLNPTRYYATTGTTITTQRGHTPPDSMMPSNRDSTKPHTSGGQSISPPGAIPTSQAEVEIRLKKMNEAFFKSLAGLGDNSGWPGAPAGGQGSTTGASSPTSASPSVPASASASTTIAHVRNRDGERLRRLMSQQGSEEVIGAIELGGSGGSGSIRRERSEGRGSEGVNHRTGAEKTPSSSR